MDPALLALVFGSPALGLAGWVLRPCWRAVRARLRRGAFGVLDVPSPGGGVVEIENLRCDGSRLRVRITLRGDRA